MSTTELKRLDTLVEECRYQLRTLPRYNPLRCQVARTLRAAKKQRDALQEEKEKEEEG